MEENKAKRLIDNEPQDDRESNYTIRKYYILLNAVENAPAPVDNLPPGYNYGDTIKLNGEQDLTGLGNSKVGDYPFIRKYDTTNPETAILKGSCNDQPYLRVAETQLKLGDKPGASEALNILRRRTHASDISDAQLTIDFILDEPSGELLGEEHRRYTLLRTGKWLEL